LQDVPKIAQLVESRLHAWFDERAVEPRFQQIILPNFWPRKKNTRGGEDGDDGDSKADDAEGKLDSLQRRRASSTHAQSRPVVPGPGPSSFEARMEAEGAKLREAEERLGLRSRHDVQREADGGDVRYRSHRRQGSGEDGSPDWHARRTMPGSMPGSLI
jgi:maintenance of mitochondrial morphology protein 1